MSWSINTRDMPSILSYAEALAFYEKTKPFKDSTHRPLAGRRSPHKAMYMLNDGSQALAFRLFRTDMVTYFPDGRVEANCYDSVSSSAFVWRLLPPGLGATSVRGRMMYVTSDNLHYTSGSTLKFARDPATNGWALTNPDVARRFTQDVVDLKKAAQARKLLAPFKQWAEIYMRLKPDGPDTNGVPAGDRYLQHLLAGGLSATPDPDGYLQMLAVLKKRRGWATKRNIWDDAKIALYAALDVVDTVTLPLGSRPHRTS